MKMEFLNSVRRKWIVAVSATSAVLVFLPLPTQAHTLTYHGGHARIESYNCNTGGSNPLTHVHSGVKDFPSTGTHTLKIEVNYYLHAPGWFDESHAKLTVGNGWDSRTTSGGPISGTMAMETLVQQGDVVLFSLYFYYKDAGLLRCWGTLYGSVNIT